MHTEPFIESAPARVLVIGVGNGLRGDDAVGLKIAGRLDGCVPAGVQVMAFRGEMIALVATWHEVSAVVLVDAMQSGAESGTVHRVVVGDAPLEEFTAHCSTHGFHVGNAIELARALGRLPETVVVYGIEGESFAMGEELSPAVAAVVDEVVDRVAGEATTLLNDVSPAEEGSHA